MECQRCLKGKDIQYRVYTDALDMKVCSSCAEEARKLGIAVEVLEIAGGRKAEVSGMTDTSRSHLDG